MKHVGRIKNTGRRCVVVFRELYDEHGKVIDPYSCLVVETESLPDWVHQDFIRIVESTPSQESSDLYTVLARSRLSDGTISLNYMAQTKRLHKYSTDNVELIPNSNHKIALSTINRIIKMQKQGLSQQEIEVALRDDTDQPPRELREAIQSTEVSDKASDPIVTSPQSTTDVLDDSALAKQMLAQSKTFESEANELREKAYALDPTLKLKPKPPVSKAKPRVNKTKTTAAKSS